MNLEYQGQDEIHHFRIDINNTTQDAKLICEVCVRNKKILHYDFVNSNRFSDFTISKRTEVKEHLREFLISKGAIKK
jgi:ATP-dependent protease Clp ATPase subunit